VGHWFAYTSKVIINKTFHISIQEHLILKKKEKERKRKRKSKILAPARFEPLEKKCINALGHRGCDEIAPQENDCIAIFATIFLLIRTSGYCS
jgi:hypothetical protein